MELGHGTKMHVAALLGCLALALAGCPKGAGDSDCDGVDPPAKTKQLGEQCISFGYGNCPTEFHDCAEGTCESPGSGPSICTMGDLTCSDDDDCPAGYLCPRSSGSSQGRCSPPKQCERFCDNGVCCNYTRDPMDPTRCIQGSCTVN